MVDIIGPEFITITGIVTIFILVVLLLMICFYAVYFIARHVIKSVFVVYVTHKLHKRYPNEGYTNKEVMKIPYWFVYVFCDVFFSLNFIFRSHQQEITNPRMKMSFRSFWPNLIWYRDTCFVEQPLLNKQHKGVCFKPTSSLNKDDNITVLVFKSLYQENTIEKHLKKYLKTRYPCRYNDSNKIDGLMDWIKNNVGYLDYKEHGYSALAFSSSVKLTDSLVTSCSAVIRYPALNKTEDEPILLFLDSYEEKAGAKQSLLKSIQTSGPQIVVTGEWMDTFDADI